MATSGQARNAARRAVNRGRARIYIGDRGEVLEFPVEDFEQWFRAEVDRLQDEVLADVEAVAGAAVAENVRRHIEHRLKHG